MMDPPEKPECVRCDRDPVILSDFDMSFPALPSQECFKLLLAFLEEVKAKYLHVMKCISICFATGHPKRHMDAKIVMQN